MGFGSSNRQFIDGNPDFVAHLAFDSIHGFVGPIKVGKYIRCCIPDVASQFIHVLAPDVRRLCHQGAFGLWEFDLEEVQPILKDNCQESSSPDMITDVSESPGHGALDNSQCQGEVILWVSMGRAPEGATAFPQDPSICHPTHLLCRILVIWVLLRPA